jgi:hypothetical protein
MTVDIESVVTSWPGVEVAPHRFGGREFTLDGREFGHSHADRQVDIPFPKRLRDVVVAEGLTSKHHLYPDSGWVTKYLRSDDDVDVAVRLLRLNYLSQVAVLQQRAQVDPVVSAVDVAAELERLPLPIDLSGMIPATSSASSVAAEG